MDSDLSIFEGVGRELIIPQPLAVPIVKDIQRKLIETANEEKRVVDEHDKEERAMRQRHANELIPLTNRRALMETTLRGLLTIYPHQTDIPTSVGEADTPGDSADLDGTERELEDSQEEEDTQEQEERDVNEGTDSKRRPRGLLLNLTNGAIREMDMPSTAENVTDHILRYHKEEAGDIDKKDIRTSLKDSRRAERVIAFTVYENGTLTYLNCLPEFFLDKATRSLKPEYEEKLLQQMIHLGLSWSQYDPQKIPRLDANQNGV